MRTISLLLLFASPAFGAEPIFEPNSQLKIEAEGDSGGEGPAWHPKLGIFSSGRGHINRLTPDGKSEIFRKDAGTNGLLWDRDGRLLACEPVKRRVTRTDADGKVTRIIGREVERANGVLVSADDKFLYVADNNNDKGGARKLWRFDLKADGTVDVKSQKMIHDWKLGRGPDGLKQDVEGRLYVAGGLNKPNPPAEPATDVKGGIYVFSPEGKLLAFQGVPRDEVTNCAFGGEDRKTLYITGGGTLYSIRTTTAGKLVWPAN